MGVDLAGGDGMSGDGRHLFCFGLGYCARTLARRLIVKGWTVSGTLRDPAKAGALEADGIAAFRFDGTARVLAIAAAMMQASHILVSVPPDEAGDPVLRAFGADIAQAAPHLAWIGYLSTVGVYGDRGGAWIDEDAPLDPVNARSRRRVAAEAAWTRSAGHAGVPLAIFRLAGIYGPGRNQLNSLRAGTAKRIVKPGQVFNRIHVDDIATVLEASMARPPKDLRAYNVCDNEPAPPQDVITYAAQLLGVAPPAEIPFDTAQMSAMAASFYADNKRCRNARIRQELGVGLAYPTYREGLGALLASDDL